MAKYGKLEVKASEEYIYFDTRMRQAIANELAESNRLKRIDLEMKYPECSEDGGLTDGA